MERKDYVAIVEKYLRRLREARKELLSETTPPTPLPRPRRFWFTHKHYFPYDADFNHVATNKSFCSLAHFLDDLAQEICEACGWQPRRILRAIRRIAAAAEWCRKRAEGRKRHAEEILRQQSRWERELCNQRTLDAIAKLGGA